MTEDEALNWLAAQPWYDARVGARLQKFVELVLAEADRQNLISSASRQEIWSRHIVDSAQLLPLAGEDANGGLWIDLGTGAGFPGMVVACARSAPIELVEMRPLRAAFLERCLSALELDNVTVSTTKVERLRSELPASIISARAYAPLDRLLASAVHLSDEKTTWLLPKGRSAVREVEAIRRDWTGMFHVEQSITDADSAIVTITALRRKYAVRPPAHQLAPRKSAARWRGK